MSTEITVGLITTGGVVIVALIGVYTARLTKKASESQQRVEERAKVIDGYDKLNEDLQTQNTKLSEAVARLETRVTELSNRIENQQGRIVELEAERNRHQRDFRTLVRYTKVLIQTLRENDIEVPAAPLDLLDYG